MTTVAAATPEFRRAVRRARLLRPRVPADAVSRQALIERLDQGLHQPLILLATPPGFGKTTLLSAWAARSPIPVAWLSIDERGDDLETFVSHIVAALQIVAPGIGRQTLTLFNLPDFPPARIVATVLEDELLDLTEETALVLDDYHLITDQSVHRFVGALLDRPPPGLRMVIATRADPPLPLARLRLHGHLAEFRAADLRFSAEESADFLHQTAGFSLDAASVAQIEQQVDGWAAGMRLAALALHDSTAPASVVAAIQGRQLRGLMDALAGELLANQPEEVRRFLLRTSIVERISAPLAVALFDDGTSEESAVATLERITRANLFLSPLEGDDRWHRYHALFRDVLRERLAGSGVDVAALHARAAVWFDDQGLTDQAIEHARTSGDEELAALIMERQIHPALDRDDLPALESWLRLLSPGVLERRPALVLGRLWVAYLRGRWALHGQLLAAAKAGLEAGATSMDPATVAALTGEIEVVQGLRLLEEGDSTGAGESARRALTLLPKTHRHLIGLAHSLEAYADLTEGRGASAIQKLDAIVRGHDGPIDLLFLRVLTSLMRLHAFSGNLHGARRTATDLHRLATEYGFWSHMSWVNYQLGTLAYELNDLDAARDHFASVVANPYQAHTVPLRESAFGLARVQRAGGFEAEARLTFERLQEFFLQTANMEQLAQVRTIWSEFFSDPGEAGAAPRAADETPRRISMLGMMAHPDVLHIQSFLQQATPESLSEAEALLEDLLRLVRTSHFVGREIELVALQSLLAQIRGQEDDAADALEYALDLAAPGGFVRTFLDRGPLLAATLRTLRPRSRHGAYIDALLAAFATETPVTSVQPPAGTPGMHHPRPPVDALTEREVEILERLAARLSYKEIADALVISPFTVKAHASNIYGKLGASGRREAIALARARGLIAGD